MSMDSVTGGNRSSLLWARVRAIIVGVACFFPASALAILMTNPLSKHYWPGDGRTLLGSLEFSFLFGIVFGTAASIYMLLKTFPTDLVK
jgi:hypothetical protein